MSKEDQGPDVKTGAEDWRTGLPDDLKNDAALKDFKDVGSLAKSYVETKKLVGGSIRLPSGKGKPEEEAAGWSDVYAKLGRPETADKYAITVGENHRPYMSEEDVKTFGDMAHKIGLSNKQAQTVIDHYLLKADGYVDSLAKERRATEYTLRNEWGAAYDRNVAVAARAVMESGGKDLLDYLDRTGLGNHPAIIKAFHKMGAILVDEGYVADDSVGSGVVDAKSEIAAIMSDRKHPYWVTSHPEHKAAVKHIAELHEIAYSE